MSKDYVLGYIDENDYDEYISLDGDTLQDAIKDNFGDIDKNIEHLFKTQEVKRKVTDFNKMAEDYSGDKNNWCIRYNYGLHSGITLVGSNNIEHIISQDELEKYQEEKLFTEYSFPFKRVDVDDDLWYNLSEALYEYVHNLTKEYNILSLRNLSQIDVNNQSDLILYGFVSYCKINNKIPLLMYF